MRLVHAIVFALSLAAPCVVDAAVPEFPYTAFVAGDQAAVRSGPGETFYPVLNLAAGDAVEVWRHDPGGWCAIRPPEGSFSWISADFVESADGRSGSVVGHQVNVRVGTQFSEVRDAVQLRLDEGDQVEILDARLLTVGDRVTSWLKIAPPAGEFRWVHESDLTRVVQASAIEEIRDAPTSPPVAAATLQASPQIELPADVSTEVALNELEIALSAMVATEPTAWHFAAMKRQAEALVERAESAVERAQARRFLGKLARFEDIAKRYASIAEVRTQTTAIDRELVQTAPPPKPEVRVTLDGTVDPSRYDGVGRLSQIVLRDGGAAAYALTNERGEVTAYVAAAPGVNLRQYAGLDVGVNGIRGFVTEQRLPQITAKRIDVLTSRDVNARR
jgi:hypothetical protein